MPTVEVPAGPIEYDDTGGDGPVVVFLHGLYMSGSTWRKVVPELGGDYRCIVPTLPFGSHRLPMKPDADLTMRGLVHLVADFLEALDLHDVTLVTLDWGGGMFLTAEGRDDRVARQVVCPTEAFDNFPPGFAGQVALLAARIPGGIYLALKQLRISWLRNSRLMLGTMFKHGVPDDVAREWTAPGLASSGVRRDVRKYSVAARSKPELIAATEKVADFTGPALVVWAPEGTMMPPEHGPRLAELFADSRYVEIADAYTMVNEDQPERLVGHLRQFLAETDAALPQR